MNNVKIKELHEIKTSIEYIHSGDPEFDSFESDEVIELVSLLAICAKNVHIHYKQGEYELARLSSLCMDDWAKALYAELKKLTEEEE